MHLDMKWKYSEISQPNFKNEFANGEKANSNNAKVQRCTKKYTEICQSLSPSAILN